MSLDPCLSVFIHGSLFLYRGIDDSLEARLEIEVAMKFRNWLAAGKIRKG